MRGRIGPWAGAGLLLAFVLLAGCDRNAPKLTACVGDQPAIPRIEDVAPPNCPD